MATYTSFRWRYGWELWHRASIAFVKRQKWKRSFQKPSWNSQWAESWGHITAVSIAIHGFWQIIQRLCPWREWAVFTHLYKFKSTKHIHISHGPSFAPQSIPKVSIMCWIDNEMKFQTRFLEFMLDRVSWNVKVPISENMYISPKCTLFSVKEWELIYETKLKQFSSHCGLNYFI